MMPGIFGRPTMDGNTALGASSPAKPALHIPEPLSTTRAATSSSAIAVTENKLEARNEWTDLMCTLST
eukprot:CAMPEP_0197646978 /NCGR_PEP_ID=MMETSP1338-20131121/23964_1 /TAXON_ID=43686 ORGANISM="Pelagodinium beii, Strain RCC1491" /NCGR_SAMPLE_ID=MMETSP1338 /ASSEMBLY_ACC=CAM_ASM_000754 /LENGTH=67 /DNA_ID=CAMNT_0043220669 /DNA_START=5 /DNA_END=205 /DNA_ORIENTATION=+